MPRLRHLSYPGHGNWRIPVKHREGSRWARLIFVGGQSDLDAAGNVQNPGRVLAQAEIAMDRVARAVEALGGRARDIVKLGVFYQGGSLAEEEALMRAIRARCTGDVPPVISLVPLPCLAYPGMAVTIEAVAYDNADGGEPRQVAAPAGHWGWPRGAEFSHGIRCGELLFLGAQMPRDGTGQIRYPDDIVAQAQLTIDNLGRVLAELGADLDDVVKLNTWYRGFGTDEDWRRAAKVRSDAFRFPGPGATGVPVPLTYPDGGLVRQECWAMRGRDGNRLPRALSWPLGHWDWTIPVPFQQGLKVGKLIFLGGQVALDPQGHTRAPDDMAAQTRIIMDSIRDILAPFDATLDDMIKVTTFFRSTGAPETHHETLAIRSGYFTDPAPAETSVPLGALGFEGLTLEIEGIAALD